MSDSRWRLLLGLPVLCNTILGAWLLWQWVGVAPAQRGFDFAAFVWFYAVGGLAMVSSGILTFFLLAAPQPRRAWLVAALINVSIPAVLMLLLLRLR